MSQPQPPIGIDLGTTYSVVATLDNEGQVQVLQNGLGQPLTPSVIFFESENNIVVGQNAKDARVNAPMLVIEFIKRQMGTDYTVELFNHAYTPIELSGIILKKLKEDAEARLNGTPITDAVVTCPAYFTAEQRDATEKAATIAGINLLALINEPTAAAVAFGMGGDKTGNALVFDLGGGTFDVTVLRFAPGNVIDVLVSDGDHELGGKDFDDTIIKMAAEFFHKETGFNLTDDLESYAELRDKAEKAKKQLSQVQKTSINLAAGGHRAKFDLSREEFNEAISGYMELMRGTVEDAISEAGLTTNDIEDVLLVGGSTYTPAIRDLVQEIFGRTPNMTVNPDEAVGRGAALYAAKIMVDGVKGEINQKKHLVAEGVRNKAKMLPTVQDIVTHSIGIRAVIDERDRVGYNSIILKRGEKIPAVSEDEFSTLVDNQPSIESSVNEGEFEEMDMVNKLAEFKFVFKDGAKPRNYPIRVKISLDQSGILRVTITDPKTRQTENVEVKYGSNMSDAEVDKNRKRLSNMTMNS